MKEKCRNVCQFFKKRINFIGVFLVPLIFLSSCIYFNKDLLFDTKTFVIAVCVILLEIGSILWFVFLTTLLLLIASNEYKKYPLALKMYAVIAESLLLLCTILLSLTQLIQNPMCLLIDTILVYIGSRIILWLLDLIVTKVRRKEYVRRKRFFLLHIVNKVLNSKKETIYISVSYMKYYIFLVVLMIIIGCFYKLISINNLNDIKYFMLLPFIGIWCVVGFILMFYVFNENPSKKIKNNIYLLVICEYLLVILISITIICAIKSGFIAHIFNQCIEIKSVDKMDLLINSFTILTFYILFLDTAIMLKDQSNIDNSKSVLLFINSLRLYYDNNIFSKSFNEFEEFQNLKSIKDINKINKELMENENNITLNKEKLDRFELYHLNVISSYDNYKKRSLLYRLATIIALFLTRHFLKISSPKVVEKELNQIKKEIYVNSLIKKDFEHKYYEHDLK